MNLRRNVDPSIRRLFHEFHRCFFYDLSQVCLRNLSLTEVVTFQGIKSGPDFLARLLLYGRMLLPNFVEG